jgi:hypothetical protein
MTFGIAVLQDTTRRHFRAGAIRAILTRSLGGLPAACFQLPASIARSNYKEIAAVF